MQVPYDDLHTLLERYRSFVVPYKSEDLLLDALIRWTNYSRLERREPLNDLFVMIDLERVSIDNQLSLLLFIIKYPIYIYNNIYNYVLLLHLNLTKLILNNYK